MVACSAVSFKIVTFLLHTHIHRSNGQPQKRMWSGAWHGQQMSYWRKRRGRRSRRRRRVMMKRPCLTTPKTCLLAGMGR